jgi:hypothetical protein
MKQLVLRTSSAQTTVGTETGAILRVPEDVNTFIEAEFILDVTAAATDVGDTLDVYVDFSPDAGATWVNAIHFTQVLGNGGAKKELAKINANTGLGTPTAPLNIAADAASGAVRNISLFEYVRYRGVMADADADGSFTWSLKAVYR